MVVLASIAECGGCCPDDYRYLGRDYRERERIRRKEARWVARLSAMTVLERRAVESAVLTVRTREATSQESQG